MNWPELLAAWQAAQAADTAIDWPARSDFVLLNPHRSSQSGAILDSGAKWTDGRTLRS